MSSSSLSSAHTLEWNEPVSCSEVVGEADAGLIDVEEDSKPSIPVRAYFFSTRSFFFNFFSVDPVDPRPLQEYQTSIHCLLFEEAFSQIGIVLREELDVLFRIYNWVELSLDSCET